MNVTLGDQSRYICKNMYIDGCIPEYIVSAETLMGDAIPSGAPFFSNYEYKHNMMCTSHDFLKSCTQGMHDFKILFGINTLVFVYTTGEACPSVCKNI